LDTAHALIDLQDHDLLIARTQRRLDDLPEKVRILELRHKIADVTKLRERTNDLVVKLSREITRLEDSVATTTTKMDDEQVKLVSGSITSPKELANISTEIDLLRRKRDKFEEELMALMERREVAEMQCAKIDEALTKAGADEARLVAQFQKAGGDILAEIDKLKKKRTRLAKDVDPEVLAKYERIRGTHHGIAAGKLEGDMCGCCRTKLPSMTVQTLNTAGTIGECPNCRRLLVVVDD
jgi:predicted  nucleic acid-binding Zn-ribbon protein